MPKGDNLKNGANAATRFSAERQPVNYRKPDTITALIRQELEGEGWAIYEGAEILDENKKPTGQKVDVRVRLVTMEGLAKNILTRAKKSDRLAIETWTRLEGKVPDTVKIGGDGSAVQVETKVNVSNLSPKEKREMLTLLEKATTSNGQENE